MYLFIVFILFQGDKSSSLITFISDCKLTALKLHFFRGAVVYHVQSALIQSNNEHLFICFASKHVSLQLRGDIKEQTLKRKSFLLQESLQSVQFYHLYLCLGLGQLTQIQPTLFTPLSVAFNTNLIE